MHANITDTIQLVELLWTLVALPGLVLWAVNRMRAQRSLNAARAAGVSNGRLVYAVFAARETTAWVAVEAGFVTIGIILMNLPVSPSSSADGARLCMAVVFIAVSTMISILAMEWRRVDQELLHSAIARMSVQQDDREVVQNVREEEQNVRDTTQDLRETGQNTRQTGQNDRQTQQDARDAVTGSE